MTQGSSRVAIVAGLRTPFLRQGGAYQQLHAMFLGQRVANALLQSSGLLPSELDRVIFGQVIQTPAAPNIAREIVLGLGWPNEIDAYSVTRACATSLQAIVSGAQSILSGESEVVLAGGADSSSMLPIGVSEPLAAALLKLQKAKTWSKRWSALKHLRPKDLLPVPPAVAEYSTGLSMGQTAEQMAKTFAISRQAQDAFAHLSHQLAASAWQDKALTAQVMVDYAPPFHAPILQDDNIRFDSSLESYGRLRPAFDKRHGSVTAGNSTPLTDGAAAVILMSEAKAKSEGHPILGYLKSYAFHAIGVEKNMLLGPAYSVPLALDKAGLSLKDCAVVEMHEAFAAQALANLECLASAQFAKEHLNRTQAVGEIDDSVLNQQGGSLAYGHPFAATGARLVTQALYQLQQKQQQYALVTACAAGGLGAAMILEAAS